MKIATYTDEKGYKRRVICKDGVPVEYGIPQEPPDLSQIDWEEVKKELHNILVDRELITLKDVHKAGNAVTSGILKVLKRRVINLYREEV